MPSSGSLPVSFENALTSSCIWPMASALIPGSRVKTSFMPCWNLANSPVAPATNTPIAAPAPAAIFLAFCFRPEAIPWPSVWPALLPALLTSTWSWLSSPRRLKNKSAIDAMSVHELRARRDVAREVAHELAEAALRHRSTLLGIRSEICRDVGVPSCLGLADRDVARDVPVTD